MGRKRRKAQVPEGAWGGRLFELRQQAGYSEDDPASLELVPSDLASHGTPQGRDIDPWEAGPGEGEAAPIRHDVAAFSKRGVSASAKAADGETVKGGLKGLPAGERPRERLLRDGGGALTDAELLAVFLRVGCPGKTAVQMAQEILDEHGGLGGMAWSDSRRLRRHGLGSAKAATVLAGIELSRRLVRVQMPQQDPLDSPGTVSSYLLLRFGRLDQEVMGALYVDARNQLLGETEIFRGTMTSASAEPRAILREAILCGAAGVIVFHTHPGGDPAPSLHDYEFTKRMAKASDLLGVRLLDHLIVGAVGRWVSMRRRRPW